MLSLLKRTYGKSEIFYRVAQAISEYLLIRRIFNRKRNSTKRVILIRFIVDKRLTKNKGYKL